MQTKLTLRIDEALIKKAKQYSEKSGKSVSQIVADYFALMDAGIDKETTELSPRMRSLVGAFAGSNLSEKDYKKYLEEKYR